MLTDKYRLKATVAVSGGRDLKLACVATDGLFSVTIALIRPVCLFMLLAICSASFLMSDWLVIAYSPVSGL